MTCWNSCPTASKRFDYEQHFEKIRQSDAFNEENRIPYTKAIVLMSLFTFVFLGAEFLFVNMISRTVSGNQSVNAQNYALGISVIGFVLYPVFSRFVKEMANRTCNVRSDFVGYLSVFDMPPCLLCTYTRHGTLAVSDSRRVWKCRILQNTMSDRGQHLYCATDRRFLYAWNLASNRKQQFGSYRLHRSRHTFCIYTIAGIYADKSRKNSVVPAFSKSKTEEEHDESGKDSLKIILLLVLFVALMTCIFGTMDNAVTVYHANGTVNIGQWPRILLALSGLMAGFYLILQAENI